MTLLYKEVVLQGTECSQQRLGPFPVSLAYSFDTGKFNSSTYLHYQRLR